MNRVVKGLLVGCGALALSAGAFTPAAFAQNHGRSYFQDRDRDYDRDRGWDHERIVREYRGAFYDRLQDDLARAENAHYLRGEDLHRFDVAHREVGKFQQKWSRGVFDRGDMDDAIASVQRVLNIPGLRRDDREALREDLARMRGFRAHMQGRRY
jgi:Ni/Co efflux regulator RcnB